MQLSNVEAAYIEKYSKALSEAKAAKTEAALNKVFDCTLELFRMFTFRYFH